MAYVSSELLFGRWQIKHFLLSSLARTLEAFPTMVMIFADYEPLWHCNGGKTPEDFLSVKPRFESCSPTGSICSMDRASWDWDGGPGVSTVSGWDLVCGQKYKVGFPQSAFFVGCLLGNWYFQALCAFISDDWSPLRFSFSFWFIFDTGAGISGHLSNSSLGHEGVLKLVCIWNAIFGFLTIMSPNFWVYLILHLLMGISNGGLGLSSFFLETKVIGPSKREPVGMSTFYFFSLGIAVLPTLSYFSGNWRYLYVASSIPSALYCIFILPFVWESPQWYLVKGRLKEAMGIMR